MKKIVTLMLIYTASCSILAMDDSHDTLNNLTREEKKTILERKRQAEFARRNTSYFSGSSTTPEDAMKTQLRYITKILDKHNIPYPEKNMYRPEMQTMLSWLDDFSKEIEQNLQNEDFRTFKETGSCIGCNFSNMDLRTDIASLNERGVPINLKGAKLQNTNLSECNLSNVNLSKTNLRSANLRRAQLRNTKLNNAYTEDADVSDAVFDSDSYSDWYGYYMRNGRGCFNIQDATVYPEDKHIKQFSETGECEGCALADTDLRHIIKSLNERSLPINLKGANLDHSNVEGADLSHADLSQTHCKQTNFSKANLTGARLSNSFCKEANFTRAILQNAIIDYTNMQNADLSYADLKNTNSDTVDLKDANTDNVSGTIFNLIKKLCNKGKPIQDQQKSPGVVDISGVDKAELLAALYNDASTGWDPSLSEDRARKILDQKTCNFDYIGRVPLKINLCSDTTYVGLYNRDHGDGAVQQKIERLRRSSRENE